jgi:hypothetical protein
MISSLFKECINQTVDGLATSFLPGRGRPGYLELLIDELCAGTRAKQQDAQGAEALRRGVPQKVAFGSAAFVGLLMAAALFNLVCQAGQYFPTYVYDLDAGGVLNAGTMGVVMAASTASA